MLKASSLDKPVKEGPSANGLGEAAGRTDADSDAGLRVDRNTSGDARDRREVDALLLSEAPHERSHVGRDVVICHSRGGGCGRGGRRGGRAVAGAGL